MTGRRSAPVTGGDSRAEGEPGHAADRLLTAIEAKRAPVCVGLDPVLERLPADLRREETDAAAAADRLETFCRLVLTAVAPHVPAVKPQSACFERYGPAGVGALESLIAAAKDLGLEVILDAKRGDIGVSARHYAAAAFGEEGASGKRYADWLTANGYLGLDALEPLARPDRGLFVLVRTSNPGSDALQGARLESGRTVAEFVGGQVAALGRSFLGSSGFSSIGAVVGATKPEEAANLRALMPRQMFLVPGYGAQGGTLETIRSLFHEDGRGAIVNASRSVIYAFEDDETNWPAAVEDAAGAFAEEVGRGVGWRG